MHKADSSVVRIWGSLQRQLEENVFYTRGWQTGEQPENHTSSFLNVEIPKATSTLGLYHWSSRAQSQLHSRIPPRLRGIPGSN